MVQLYFFSSQTHCCIGAAKIIFGHVDHPRNFWEAWYWGTLQQSSPHLFDSSKNFFCWHLSFFLQQNLHFWLMNFFTKICSSWKKKNNFWKCTTRKANIYLNLTPYKLQLHKVKFLGPVKFIQSSWTALNSY